MDLVAFEQHDYHEFPSYPHHLDYLNERLDEALSEYVKAYNEGER